jgi:lipopolysaccharide export LptBFGC system permease protein LptF
MGKSGWIAPFWSAWIPNLLFFALGIFMVVRIRRV